MSTIPNITASGVLPPFLGSSPTVSGLMSPYEVKMTALVARYATSLPRVRILKGLLSYRADLIAAGVGEGLQWIAGSFIEDVETIRRVPPKDVDLVTFARVPVPQIEKTNYIQANINLFSPGKAKKKYNCDARFVDLEIKPELIVEETRYYFGLFSHQYKTSLWKGLLAVSLNCEDEVAMQDLLVREGELNAA